MASADRIVLPGDGAFADCRRGLESLPGMVDALAQAVRAVPGVTGFDVEAENFESIHNHSAWARIVS
ncbi:MAG: GTP cyclohydrolase, FolE2/MptA family [Burkholderiaceae bacterium]